MSRLKPLKWYAIVGVLVVLLAIFSAPPSASAAKTPSQVVVRMQIVRLPSPPGYIRRKALASAPYIVKTRCLATGATAYSPSPNDVDSLAEVTNNCLATTSLFMGMSITGNCSGKTSSGSTGWNLRLYVGSTGDEPQNWGIGCVICLNGKPVGYPPFSATVQVQANGTFIYHNIEYQTDSNTATDTTNVANDGLYAPPCSPN